MILVIGEILYALFPSYKRFGEVPFNFAFPVKGMGFNVGFFVSGINKYDPGKGYQGHNDKQ